jgi:multisubunit Na+/H+ antiporter MnhE subunit
MTNLLRFLTILLFRTFLWGLVTGNFGENNMIGGLVLSAIIPMGDYKKLKFIAIIPSISKIIKLPIQLIKESCQLMLIQNPIDIHIEKRKNRFARQGSKIAKFVDVLVITATPMSLVTGSQDENNWSIHTVKERGGK